MTMNEIDAKITLGIKRFNAGKAIYDKGYVHAPIHLGYGIIVISIENNTDSASVVIRNYTDGREQLYDCDCGKNKCDHIAAAMISMISHETVESNNNKEEIIDNESIIEEIEEDIDSLYNTIATDNDYDEDDNYYEEWEINKYDIESFNEDVEYDHTNDICSKIVNNISNPQTFLHLFNRLHIMIDEFEYDNGGFDRALSEYDEPLKVMFGYAKPDVILEILTVDKGYRESWAKDYLEYLAPNVLNEIYNQFKDQDTLGNTALKMLFENGDYELYVEKSPSKVDSLIKVIEKIKNSDKERVRKFGILLSKQQIDDHSYMNVANAFAIAGMNENAQEIYIKLFIESPNDELVNKIAKIADKNTINAAVHNAMTKRINDSTFNPNIMSCLARNGCCKEVEEHIRHTDYKVTFTCFHNEPEYNGMVSLCRILANYGYYETSAHLAHDLIKYRLDRKDPKSYDDAVSMLRFLDSIAEFEKMIPAHSIYKSDLLKDYKTMRKFWGLYNNTWSDNTKRNRWY